jgi:hypothetical protein
VETPKTELTLGEFPLGGRLLVRSKKDWRFAVISRKTDEFISLSIASPKGGNYRIKRAVDLAVAFDGLIPFLRADYADTWRDNFSGYDMRW